MEILIEKLSRLSVERVQHIMGLIEDSLDRSSGISRFEMTLEELYGVENCEEHDNGDCLTVPCVTEEELDEELNDIHYDIMNGSRNYNVVQNRRQQRLGTLYY